MKLKKLFALSLSLILSASALLFTGCKKDKKLWEYYEDYFKVGCTMNYGTQDMYEDIAGEFNSMTCENEVKWNALEPTEGTFDFTVADKMVAFAKNNKMAVRGHCLAWHNPLALPNWVFTDTGSDGKPVAATFEKVKARLVNHATEVVKHFGTEVYAWDVWNEMLTDKYTSDENDLYRVDSQWHAVCGLTANASPEEKAAANERIEELIVATFAAARKANPKTKLFYNEYFVNNSYKMKKILTMVDRLQKKGCEIDGVGIQAHYDINSFDAELLDNLIAELGKRGLEVQITEVDFSMYDYNADKSLYYQEFTEDMQDLQASCFGKVFEVCRKHKDVVTAVVQWGVADDDSYLHKIPVEGRKDWPYLFDEYHEKKDAYYAIINF